MAQERKHTPFSDWFVRETCARIGTMASKYYGTNYAFSNAVGFHKDTVSKYVAGNSVPSLENMGLMIEAFHLTPEEFFRFNDPDPEKTRHAMDLFFGASEQKQQDFLSFMEIYFSDDLRRKQRMASWVEKYLASSDNR